MKEEIEDVFSTLDLEFDVDVYVQGTFDIKVQVIGHGKNNDIYKLYNSVKSCLDRLESLDLIVKEFHIALSTSKYTHPRTYIVNSASEIQDILKFKENQFFGYIIYFEKYKINEIKKWKEFSLNEQFSKEDWNGLMDIVKDFHDDIDMKFDLGFSRVYQNKGVGGDVWDRDIQLDFIIGSQDAKEMKENRKISKFNESILSRLEWIVEKDEAKIESLRILLNDQDLAHEKFGSKGMINLHGKISEDFLNQIDDELKSVIVGWWITFSPKDQG